MDQTIQELSSSAEAQSIDSEGSFHFKSVSDGDGLEYYKIDCLAK